MFCGDPQAAYPVAERTVALASRYGFPLWVAGGHMLRGWARLDLGDVKMGLAEIQQSVTALEATGALTWVHFARYLLAQALTKSRQSNDALELIDTSLNLVSCTSGRWYEAELHRLKGDALLDLGDFPAAESCYRAAITVSTRQGAKLWQLRAANALASLWRAQGNIEEAQSLIGPLRAAFGNVTSNADLERAEALLRA